MCAPWDVLRLRNSKRFTLAKKRVFYWTLNQLKGKNVVTWHNAIEYQAIVYCANQWILNQFIVGVKICKVTKSRKGENMRWTCRVSPALLNKYNEQYVVGIVYGTSRQWISNKVVQKVSSLQLVSMQRISAPPMNVRIQSGISLRYIRTSHEMGAGSRISIEFIRWTMKSALRIIVWRITCRYELRGYINSEQRTMLHWLWGAVNRAEPSSSTSGRTL